MLLHEREHDGINQQDKISLFIFRGCLYYREISYYRRMGSVFLSNIQSTNHHGIRKFELFIRQIYGVRKG